LTAPKSI
jgi:hypothetical protein